MKTMAPIPNSASPNTHGHHFGSPTPIVELRSIFESSSVTSDESPIASSSGRYKSTMSPRHMGRFSSSPKVGNTAAASTARSGNSKSPMNTNHSTPTPTSQANPSPSKKRNLRHLFDSLRIVPPNAKNSKPGYLGYVLEDPLEAIDLGLLVLSEEDESAPSKSGDESSKAASSKDSDEENVYCSNSFESHSTSNTKENVKSPNSMRRRRLRKQRDVMDQLMDGIRASLNLEDDCCDVGNSREEYLNTMYQEMARAMIKCRIQISKSSGGSSEEETSLKSDHGDGQEIPQSSHPSLINNNIYSNPRGSNQPSPASSPNKSDESTPVDTTAEHAAKRVELYHAAMAAHASHKSSASSSDAEEDKTTDANVPPEQGEKLLSKHSDDRDENFYTSDLNTSFPPPPPDSSFDTANSGESEDLSSSMEEQVKDSQTERKSLLNILEARSEEAKADSSDPESTPKKMDKTFESDVVEESCSIDTATKTPFSTQERPRSPIIPNKPQHDNPTSFHSTTTPFGLTENFEQEAASLPVDVEPPSTEDENQPKKSSSPFTSIFPGIETAPPTFNVDLSKPSPYLLPTNGNRRKVPIRRNRRKVPGVPSSSASVGGAPMASPSSPSPSVRTFHNFSAGFSKISMVDINTDTDTNNDNNQGKPLSGKERTLSPMNITTSDEDEFAESSTQAPTTASTNPASSSASLPGFSIGLSDKTPNKTTFRNPRSKSRTSRLTRPNIPNTNPPKTPSLLSTRIAELRTSARKSYQTGDYKSSILSYTSAIAAQSNTNPNSADLAILYGNRAAALMMLGAYEAAARDCDLALKSPDLSTKEDGTTLKTKLYCRMGRALLKQGIAEKSRDTFFSAVKSAKQGLENPIKLSTGSKNVLSQCIADATLGLTDVQKLYEAINSAERLHHTSAKMGHWNKASEISPGSLEIFQKKIVLLKAQREWSHIAYLCEKWATDKVLLDGIFTRDLRPLDPFQGASPAEDLKADFFDEEESDRFKGRPFKTLCVAAVCDAVVRLPPSVMPLYLRSLRLEERYAEGARASTALEVFVSSCSSTATSRMNLDWLPLEREKLRQTRTNKERGDLLFRCRDYDRAAQKYSECLTLDLEPQDSKTPGYDNAGGRLHAILYCNRAACWMAVGKYFEAIRDCGGALAVQPNYMKAILRRARCHARLEMFQEALVDFQRWIDLVETSKKKNSGHWYDKASEIHQDDMDGVVKECNDVKRAMRDKIRTAQADVEIKKERERWYNEKFKAPGTEPNKTYGRTNTFPWEGKRATSRSKSTSREERKSASANSSTSADSRRHKDRGSQNSKSIPKSEKYKRSQSQNDVAKNDADSSCHYQVLQVTKTCSAAAIKKSYHKMALKYHPDKNKELGATDNFRQIQSSYEILKDDRLRRKYDAEQRLKQYCHN